MWLSRSGGGMESWGRLAIGLLELLLHRKAGRLTIGRRMPSCPTLAQGRFPNRWGIYRSHIPRHPEVRDSSPRSSVE
jgi:hypothetical protein